MTCSCGETEVHVVAKRKTFDNYTLLFWDDGAVTTGMGGYVVRGGRTNEPIEEEVG